MAAAGHLVYDDSHRAASQIEIRRHVPVQGVESSFLGVSSALEVLSARQLNRSAIPIYDLNECKHSLACKTASRRRTALLFVQDNLSPGIEHPTPLSRQDLKHIRRRKNRILHDGTSVLPGVHMAILARSE
jgi:hypothetical protein